MKKITLLLSIAALSLFFFSSCLKDATVQDLLTEEKKNDIAAQDPDKTYSADVMAMYSHMQSYVHTNMSHNYFGQKSFDYLTSLMGNDMIMTGRFAMSIYHYLLDYRAAGYIATSNRWQEYYRMISYANNILAGIDPETQDAAVLNYKAIALSFRSYAYWQLSNLYSYAYYVGADGTKWGKGAKYDHSQDLCVPIVTETLTGKQPRSTVEQVSARMIEDFEIAFEIFKANGNIKTPSPTDVDGCVVASYLMRAFMVKHDWENAAKYAKVVMDNFPVLSTEADITQGFSTLTLPNVVFAADITIDNATTYASWFSQMDSYGDGYAGIGVWRAGFKPLVDRIPDTDIRLQWFCCARSTGGLLRDTKSNAAVDYQSVKFIGTGRENIKAGIFAGWELGDYIYLRSEEAYLTYAEALVHQGLDGKATLETFVKTRDPKYVCAATSKSDLLDEINFQKRVEFWGEGIEYIDNRRLNIPVDRTDETWGKTNNNHFDGAKLKVEQESLLFLYQIPLSEIENNDLIGPENQNP